MVGSRSSGGEGVSPTDICVRSASSDVRPRARIDVRLGVRLNTILPPKDNPGTADGTWTDYGRKLAHQGGKRGIPSIPFQYLPLASLPLSAPMNHARARPCNQDQAHLPTIFKLGI